MSIIINSRDDLESLRGGNDYAAVLKIILGATTTWINRGTDKKPDWRQETVLEQMKELGFETLDELLAECAAAGVTPPDSQPPPAVILPPLTAADVRAAARRRLMVSVGAQNTEQLTMIILNKIRETIRLLLKGEAKWTAAERAMIKEYSQMDATIEKINAAGKIMEAAPSTDFEDDKYWP